MATMLSSVRANMDRQGLKELERLLFEFKIANCYHRNNPSAPVSVTLYLHARCNLNCSMCWRNADFAAERLKQKEVPLSRWEKTIVELAEMGCRSIKFSGGGEPLLYPGFLKLAILAKGFNMCCMLTTNGTLLDKHMRDELDRIGWDEVTVSLDGPTEEINNSIRGKGFDRVIRNISESRDRSFKTYLQTVMQMENLGSLENMLNLVKEHRMDGIKFLPAYDWNRKQIDFDIDDELSGAYKKAMSLNIWTNLSSLIDGGYKLEKADGTCFYPWFYCLIDELGDVKPCCHPAVTRDAKVSMGNIDKESIRDIWTGERFNELREQFRKGALIDACSRCFGGNIEFNNALNVQISRISISSQENMLNMTSQ